jgi:hypothetical protein
MLHILSVCLYSYFSALLRAVLYYQLWPVRPHHIFPYVLQTARFSEKKYFEHEICDSIFSANFFLTIFHSKKNWARCIINVPSFFVKSPILLAGFNETCIFSTDSRKLSYQISWKSIQWEPSSMRTDGRTHGQTDRHVTKLIDDVCSSANVPKHLVPFYSANRTKPINTIDRKQCL